MKAIFKEYTEIRIGNIRWCINGSDEPQTFPKRVIDAAVEKGAAEIVPPKRKKRPSGPKSGD